MAIDNKVKRPLEGKIAVVTGASRGIGASIARNLGAKGAHILAVYTSDSSTEPTEQLRSELEAEHGIRFVPCKADLTKPEEASAIIAEKAEAAFAANGELKIDIIINNAGVGGDYKLGDVPTDEFWRIYTVNVLAPIWVMQALLPYLPRDRSGRVVNISSVASSMGFATHTLYGGTKAALEAMTRTWARELAERCTVNAVNPGPVEGDRSSESFSSKVLCLQVTEANDSPSLVYFAAGEKFWKQMEPFQLNCPLSAIREGFDAPALVELAQTKMGGRRPAYWSEVAGVVGMLCTEDAAWTTGSVICANGGFKFQG